MEMQIRLQIFSMVLVTPFINRTSDLLAKGFNGINRDIEPSFEIGHCKVFMESEDVGRTLDLSTLGSYEELYRKLANMFGIESSEMLSHVLYRDLTGSVKQIGNEPFSDFTKTAKRLTILMDSSSDNVGN